MDLNKESVWQIIDNLSDGLYIVDRQRRIVFWNHAAEAISGFNAAEITGISCADNLLCHVDERGTNLCRGDCPLTVAISEGKPHRSEMYLHHKDGHRIPISTRVTPLKDPDGEIIGAVEIFNDISSRISTEQRLKELERIAMLDRLTQLANRHFLERELEACMEEKKRYGYSFGVLFMDIDNFKLVNDRFGHDSGDRVLQYVAATLSANSRPFDLYGRWGGEEFLGIVRNVTPDELRRLGERLRTLVAESFIQLDGDRIQVTVSVGATLVNDTDTIKSLTQRADDCMYQSKKNGRNCLTFG